MSDEKDRYCEKHEKFDPDHAKKRFGWEKGDVTVEFPEKKNDKKKKRNI